MPSGFFDRNPCLDLPYDGNTANCDAKLAPNGKANGG